MKWLHVCVKKKCHYLNVVLSIQLNLEKKRYKHNTSEYNKRNEQYEIAAWLTSWYVAPYIFVLFLVSMNTYSYNILEITCI